MPPATLSGMDLPPAPPPRPDAVPVESPFEERRSSGRRGVLIAAIALLAVGAIALVAFLSGSGDGFPDEALGYERMHDAQADRVESAMEAIRIGEIEISTALYGEDGDPRLLAATYENFPEIADAGSIIQGAAAGAESTGGTVDESTLQTSTGDGYTYACMRGGGTGFLIPGGPPQEGVLCVFEGEVVGIIVTTRTTEPIAGLADVRAFVEAYETG
jgi:hypothetical protein